MGIFRALAAVAAPVLLMFVHPALLFIERNPEYFLLDLKAALPFAALSGFTMCSALLCYLLRHKMKSCAAGLFGYLLLAPLWMAYVGLDLETRDSFYVIPLVALIGGFVLARLSWRESLITGFAIYSAVLIIDCGMKAISIENKAVEMAQKKATERKVQNIPMPPTRSDLPDIYHIVFDEFQSDLFGYVLDEDAEKKLAGYTWLPNATSPFGRTEMALSAMLSGKAYDYQQSPHDYIDQAFYGEQSLLTRMKAEGYRTIGYLHMNYPKGRENAAFDVAYYSRDLSGDLSLFDRQALLISLWVYAYLPKQFYEAMIPTHQLEQLESQSLLPNDAPYGAYQMFQHFMKTEAESKSRGGRYIFVHLLLPHFPTVLREDCGYARGVITDAPQQNKCALKLMGDFTEMLKAQDRFKDSFIIMHGDHGALYLLKNGKLIEAEDRFYGPDFTFARARAAIIFKPTGEDGASVDTLKRDNRPTDLFDYYPTLMDDLGVEANDSLTGDSWLQAAPQPTRQRYYHFYDKATDENRVVEGALHRFTVDIDGAAGGEEKLFDVSN